ncbi:hypothetical protein NQ317_011570 [Molorchus minor]|uniref:Chitinase n=1 Tax=Molorchus minor TaxID=1323400 RepID=A0ABQ9JTE3_9CUCU|nr:hypothetical protein NQ317_011570 [Molorchus minor]
MKGKIIYGRSEVGKWKGPRRVLSPHLPKGHPIGAPFGFLGVPISLKSLEQCGDAERDIPVIRHGYFIRYLPIPYKAGPVTTPAPDSPVLDPLLHRSQLSAPPFLRAGPKKCQPMYPSSKIEMKCVDKRGTEIPCHEATDGSYLSYKCASFYETPFGYKKRLLCEDGSWNYPKPVCQPAAHCVTNNYGDVQPAGDFSVGAGKLYNKYNDSRDPDAQYLEIDRVIVNPGYKGAIRDFQADVALLVTKGYFTLNEWVQPACFNDVNNLHIYAGNIGVISGWGVKEDGLPADKLKVLEIPYKYETTCAQELPKRFADTYAMIDKICAGFLNKSISVCKGDSGGGLAFKNPEDNRYYVHGVVSMSPTENGQCNIQQNALYTKVAFYYEFLERQISKYHVEECTLPPYPLNGKWVTKNRDEKPGRSVSSTALLKYTCDQGFRLSSDTSEIQCDTMKKPTCQYKLCIQWKLEFLFFLGCPEISFPPSTEVSCKNSKDEAIKCSVAAENTVLTYTCPLGFDIPEGESVELQETHPSRIKLGLHRYKRQSITNGVSCTLPPQPDNGKWSVVNGKQQPGEKISENTLVKYECNEGYKLSASQYIVCDNNWKSAHFPECEKKCQPMYSSSKIELKCVDKRGTEIPCHEATDGSYLSYKCASFYETPFGYKKTLLCMDGSWNYPKPVCQPVCGKKINDDNSPLIYGGETKEVIEYPWVTAIYAKNGDQFLNICGGTIISPRVILTAAHCVTNNYGDVQPAGNFRVGAGKLHNKYNDSRDPDAQYLEVDRVIVHPGYKGENRRFQADVALLVTKGSFTLNEWVQPACFNDVNNLPIYAGNIGVISGWGVKEDGLPADKLKVLEIPYKYETTCAQELPKDWADKYAMIDKICAGFFNKSMSVCKGDSGGGLAFKNPEDNRYYVHGVVSIGPSEKGQCNIQQNSLYTKVAFYYEFLDRELSKYHVEECTLPPYPLNGKWVTKNKDQKPGRSVSSTTLLKYTCDQGFRLSSDTSEIQCDTIKKPTCQLGCPEISFPPSTEVSCKNSKGEAIKCSVAAENTLLTYTCPPGFNIPEGGEKTSRCRNGSWGTPTPACVPTESTPVPVPSKFGDGSSQKVICSYASWQAYKGTFPEDLDVSLCTHLVYAYIGLFPDGRVRVQDNPLDLGDSSKRGLYYRMTDLKNLKTNLKVLLSVGGAGASNASLYSSMAADPQKRRIFISSAKAILKTYNFDGLDIEWHIPAVEDKVNYITLLREIRNDFKQHGYLLTASVRSDPTNSGYDGAQMNDILDWVVVKTFDMYGAWSKYTGQNSPLYASSEEYEWEKQHLSVDVSAKNWLAAGMTKEKLILSIAFYGRSFTLADRSQHGIHAPIAGPGPGEDGGFLRYSEICRSYNDWTRVWDNEQKNPYRYNEDKWFGYDDKESVGIKATYIKSNGYLGVNVWPVDGDDVHGKCGTKQVLLKEINRAFGFRVDLDRQSITFTCTLPSHPEHGAWILQNGAAKEGDQVPHSSFLIFECKIGYKLSTTPYVICDQRWDAANMPKCLKLCPPLTSSSTTFVKCLKDRQEVACHEATHNTYMSYSCAPFYESPFGYKTTSLCLDGDWNTPAPVCQPVCGRKNDDDATPLVYGGTIEKFIEYPWVAVLYMKINGEYINICGGTIINQRLILTAAHCVTTSSGNTLPENIFLAAAGKLFNRYNDTRDPAAQYLNVERIVLHPSYKADSRRYEADIAVLITEQRFKLNKFIQPVCFTDVNKIQLLIDTEGVVSGFGVKEGGLPSDELRTLKIPYKSQRRCVSELPPDWADRYKVLDKICAGYHNKSMGICKGDSGNGFFFSNPINKRFYVHGVVSLGHSIKGQCNIQQNALYTNVSYHYDFIDRELTRYYIKDCTLPAYPEHGKWTIKNTDKKPGDTVPASTFLEVGCEDGYKLSSSVAHFTCEALFELPTCDSKYSNQDVCFIKLLSSLHFAVKSTKMASKPDELNASLCNYVIFDSVGLNHDGTLRVKKENSHGKYKEQKILFCFLKNQEITQSWFGLSKSTIVILVYRSITDMKKTNPKLKVLLSVYGTAKARTDPYPTMALDSTKRITFVTSVKDCIEKHNFDGLDINWSVPYDKASYIGLMKELKDVLEPKNWLLTTTVYFAPTYLGYDLTNLNPLVNWINVESYGFYDEWSKYTGQNAALYPSTEETGAERDLYNVKASLDLWTGGGFLKKKISIGVAFFGRSYTLTVPRKHGIHAPVTGSTSCNHTERVNYAVICDKYSDWRRVWDDEQKTPYKYHKDKWIGYDDGESIKLKVAPAAYADKYDYFGVTVNSIDKDDVYGKCGPKQALLKSIHAGLGNEEILDPADGIEPIE